MEDKNLNEVEKSTKAGFDVEKEREAAIEEEKRVRVLSPGMLVAKRFFRNKLAMIGLVILVVMFLFSFVGALFTPYSESQVFRKVDVIKKEYATALFNNELRYTVADGKELSAMVKAQFLMAKTQKQNVFEYDREEYAFGEVAEGVFCVGEYTEVAKTTKDATTVTPVGAFSASADFTAAYNEAVANGNTGFVVGDTVYTIYATKDNTVRIGKIDVLAVASTVILDTLNADYTALLADYDFVFAAQVAAGNNETEFVADGVTYGVQNVVSEGANLSGEITLNGEPIVELSNIILSGATADVVLSPEFKTEARKAISEGDANFSFKVEQEDGTEIEYYASTVNANIYITSLQRTELLDSYAKPSDKHALGTDANGMDLFTRLMYGGRISLMVGFVVIFIEMVIGIVVGGISGFFGGFVDMALMRFVDLFNSIPYWPMLIIAGSVMDGLRLESNVRIFTLMFILGFLNWTGIARVVRGQILTLREQEFMVACEANGIRTSRRIFKHLVPNVMPILIVQATMGLGSVIISEATLSFLGLGVKYPQASWGSIINAATDIYVMTNYWWMWIPAGACILITVLGFNFVGDGLRDAFDPKMKR